MEILSAVEKGGESDTKKRTNQLSGSRYQTIYASLQFVGELFDLRDVGIAVLSVPVALQAIGNFSFNVFSIHRYAGSISVFIFFHLISYLYLYLYLYLFLYLIHLHLY